MTVRYKPVITTAGMLLPRQKHCVHRVSPWAASSFGALCDGCHIDNNGLWVNFPKVGIDLSITERVPIARECRLVPRHNRTRWKYNWPSNLNRQGRSLRGFVNIRFSLKPIAILQFRLGEFLVIIHVGNNQVLHFVDDQPLPCMAACSLFCPRILSNKVSQKPGR